MQPVARFCALRGLLPTPCRFRRRASSASPCLPETGACHAPVYAFKEKSPSETLTNATFIQVFLPCLLSFFFRWCSLVLRIKLMPYKRIEFLLQACCNFICVVIILEQMKFYKCHEQFVWQLNISFQILSHPFRDGRVDGDGLFETAPTIKNIVTTVTIDTLYSVCS